MGTSASLRRQGGEEARQSAAKLSAKTEACLASRKARCGARSASRTRATSSNAAEFRTVQHGFVGNRVSRGLMHAVSVPVAHQDASEIRITPYAATFDDGLRGHVTAHEHRTAGAPGDAKGVFLHVDVQTFGRRSGFDSAHARRVRVARQAREVREACRGQQERDQTEQGVDERDQGQLVVGRARTARASALHVRHVGVNDTAAHAALARAGTILGRSIGCGFAAMWRHEKVGNLAESSRKPEHVQARMRCR